MNLCIKNDDCGVALDEVFQKYPCNLWLNYMLAAKYMITVFI